MTPAMRRVLPSAGFMALHLPLQSGRAFYLSANWIVRPAYDSARIIKVVSQ